MACILHPLVIVGRIPNGMRSEKKKNVPKWNVKCVSNEIWGGLSLDVHTLVI